MIFVCFDKVYVGCKVYSTRCLLLGLCRIT